MITLKDLVRSDRAIGAITTDECHLIAVVLDAASKSWLFRRALPAKFRDGLPMRMLASTLSRTPAEREPESLNVQIWREMQRDK